MLVATTPERPPESAALRRAASEARRARGARVVRGGAICWRQGEKADPSGPARSVGQKGRSASPISGASQWMKL